MNPKVLEVNLIKDEKQVDFDWQHNFSTLLFSLFVAALFLVEIYVGLNWWANYEEERALAAEAKFNLVSKQIKEMRTESDEILAFKERADIAHQLLDNHVYWTNFFNWLEKNTLSSVNYHAFSGGTDGVYQLQASTKTYRDISWQTRAMLENPSILSARVDRGTTEREEGEEKVESETVNFTLDLKVDPQLFRAASK
ncbi:hypothetical protein CVU83_02800 [Candidatus Falkowbacteria bacterium HGW-Falkowbacteria-2]|uniref:Fimbrial assembly protein n=1 Tax=Candidatus Falkowbacteria bacterium HGW-Falkowbacteria-2 TaxID=2013769 RepID=A0A2N2DYT3_9BACT|nr:MAG: hypothetical protein CVU83_02800 [Candidatus Falkowbacteria bacterium HGW-Falkowbacteria-2]